MSKNLVIVESPAKAKTIEKYLGPDFRVLSSYGHIRDLPKKDLAVDVEGSFEPTYVVTADKKKRLSELKKAALAADTIWLATDRDREGEAIAWHLAAALDLSPEKTRRIEFSEITKPAVEAAIQRPRQIDQHLVDAQQARRVLDRLVGYEISPVLWRKVSPGLSAGRVQSVAVRLIVEREREIENFATTSSFKLSAEFTTGPGERILAELADNLADQPAAEEFIKAAESAIFQVADVQTKPTSRNPGPPFTTSTLQQTAARKLSFSVKQTMVVAQRLYEAGHITYMRTDSVILAAAALSQAESLIKKSYGADYHEKRSYQNKAGSQEAHEAIRPTDFARQTAGEDERQQKLYRLIHSRALASQMAPARLEKSTLKIASSGHREQLVAEGEVVRFPGFLKVYQDSKMVERRLPPVASGQTLDLKSLEARQAIARAPARYNEAALVRTLERMGIGRPSTYAPTISTIQDRGYVEKGDIAGEERQISVITLENGRLKSSSEAFMYGRDQNKLLPTQVALLVNDFLTKQFADVVDYDFTKEVEEEFDRIAKGKERWNRMIADFYGPFHKLVDKAESLSREQASGARELGSDPASGKPVIVRMGRYGPMIQRGRADDQAEKPDFAPLPKGRKIHEVSLAEALRQLTLPRRVGQTKEGEEITASYGPFGPYVKLGSTYAAIPTGNDPFGVTVVEAERLIAEKRSAAAQSLIADHGQLKIKNGRFGPYITDGKRNVKVPKDQDAAKLSADAAQTIFAAAPPGRRRTKRMRQ